jgi:MFS transporter, UMF1 family
MGGVQSTSRATYTKLIPTSHSATASFFAFYSATDRLAIILGTLAFGAMNQLTGSMRTSILLMMLCSIAGLVLLLVLPWRRYAGSTAGIVSGYAN